MANSLIEKLRDSKYEYSKHLFIIFTSFNTFEIGYCTTQDWDGTYYHRYVCNGGRFTSLLKIVSLRTEEYTYQEVYDKLISIGGKDSQILSNDLYLVQCDDHNQ